MFKAKGLKLLLQAMVLGGLFAVNAHALHARTRELVAWGHCVEYSGWGFNYCDCVSGPSGGGDYNCQTVTDCEKNFPDQCHYIQ